MTRSSGPACRGVTLVEGAAVGSVVVLDAPLSLWGGMGPDSGVIIDRHHPQYGVELAGRILVMTEGRGSSSSSSVLAEAVRAGTAPAGIVLTDPDEIIVVGALVAAELYGATLPVVRLEETDYARLGTGEEVRVTARAGAATVEWVTDLGDAG